MERLSEDKPRIFDDFYSNDTLTLLKVMSFFMDQQQTPMLAVFIKYMEFNICIKKSMKQNITPVCLQKNQPAENLEDLLSAIEDYLPKESKELIDQIKNAKETMETYSQMMEMMNMMQQSEDGFAPNSDHSVD